MFLLSMLRKTRCPVCGRRIQIHAAYCKHCAAWLAQTQDLACGSFNWGLVHELEADLLMPPEKNYLAILERFLTIACNLPEVECAKAFRNRIQFFDTTELNDIYRSAFQPDPDVVLRAGWPAAAYCTEMINKMRTSSKEFGLDLVPETMPGDHLVAVLRAMGRSNSALGEDVATATLPAVSKIVSNMDQSNPFSFLMEAIEQTVTAR